MKILNEKQKIEIIRKERSKICFPIVNRGKLWYDSLNYSQLAELKKWYFNWLDATETKIIPKTPDWINDKIEMEEIIL